MEGRIRLKNLAAKAEKTLIDWGMRGTVARDLLRPASEIVEDEQFWEMPIQGLAVYLAPGFFKRFILHEPPLDRCLVGDRFMLRPLLSLLRPPDLYVLALDQAHTRLVRVAGPLVEEVGLPDMPVSIKEITAADYSEKQMQAHSAGRSMVMHGAGDRAADNKNRLLRFALAVDRAVTRHLSRTHAELVLAADSPVLEIYRNATRYRNIAEKAVVGSPNLLSLRQLADRARCAADECCSSDVKSLVERYGSLEPQFLASDSPESVRTAATEGRVDALLISKPAVANDDDERERQINESIAETFVHSGRVFELDAACMPTKAEVAAIFRY